jgi:hypothetical protein
MPRLKPLEPWRSSRFVAVLLALPVLAGLPAADLAAAPPIPAFPGAAGFGGDSAGGRGGDVYVVTTLDRDGPGSFLEGIRTVPPAGRTIVFAVSGFIPISKPHLQASRVTIAGQTAPGGGVCLTGSSLRISGADVVIRHLRFRHGRGGNGGDCLNPGAGAERLLIDHCDVMFANDENISMFHGTPPTMTFQWSTVAWGLYDHSCGGLWTIDHATAHHTLWAHNKTRNPKVICPRLLDWRNNVSFGWDIGMNLAGADQGGEFKVNLVGSTFIRGSGRAAAVFGAGPAPDGTLPFAVHVADCGLDGNGAAPPEVTAEGYEIIDTDEYRRSEQPFPQTLAADPTADEQTILGVAFPTDDRRTALKKVLSQVGPLRLAVDSDLALRDEVTSLLVADVVAQERRKISHENELPVPNSGFGTLPAAAAPADGDRDGMPDVWEAALGWDRGRQDHNRPLAARGGRLAGRTFFPADTPAGYTRLEEYLHFLAVPHGELAPGGTLRIDLARFTSGFVRGPTITCSEVWGGSVEPAAPDGGQVVFTAPRGRTGRAGFLFTVKDEEGSSWTQQCLILVRSAR